jgi:NAD(P)-dependent dehydrogenase (short-subunit alcohol dehydrogenase family)
LSAEQTNRALVTGAARGIGAAIAARLAREGLEVTTLDRADGADLQLDVASDPLDAKDFDAFDVVVANAGITDTIAPAHRMTDEQWRRDVDVNLTGAYRVIRAALAGMRDRGYGRICAISSGAATAGLGGQVAYAASKAGLIGMVKTLAVEGLRHGITANAVLTGTIATEKVRAMPPDVLSRVESALPMGRMGEPDEVAALVAYLCSEGAAYVTGQQVAIAGGFDLNTFTLGSPAKT